MRIYVGTLYSGENEFEACVHSIKKQTYKNWEQFVYKGLPKKEAHDSLYSDFMASDYDILIHLGADLVLKDNDFFAAVNKIFTENLWLQHFSVTVHDFFSDQPIWGLNSYRNMAWEKTDELVYTDFVPVKSMCQISHSEPPLAPAAFHCPNPSYFQSFHYGAHKAMKLMESQKRGYTSRVVYYSDIIEATYDHYLRTRDFRLGLCIDGARYATRAKLGPSDLDYTNPHLKEVFERGINRVDTEQESV